MTNLARLLIAVATTFVPFSAFAQAPVVPNQSQSSAAVRLACISLQRVFSESPDGKTAITRLTALQEEKARAIDEKNKALQSQEQALEQSAPLLSEAARTQRSSQVEKFRIDVQRFIQDAQAELMGIQRDTESAFLVKLRPALQKVAQDKGLQIVFNVDDGQIPWFDPSIDITSEVVKQLAQK